MWQRALVVCAVLAGQTGCAPTTGCDAHAGASTCTRVLFIGNSYTFVNDLPGTFAGLAATGGHQVETGMLAFGGATLGARAADPATTQTVGSARWSVVVLQEQSEIPSVQRARDTEMYPAVRQLVRVIRDAGARPMLYLTWAHRNGWPANGLNGYRVMQSAIEDGYLAIAAEQHTAVAPVGAAWAALLAADPDPGLWQPDGSHPTAAGTYLAACVFYAAVFRASPLGLDYHADLSPDQAARLQSVAADVVLAARTRWGLA